MIRSAVSCFRVSLLAISRGPLIAASIVVFVCLLAALPTVRADDRAELLRQHVAWELSGGAAILFILAVTLPIGRGAQLQRERDARIAGRMVATLAHALALVVVLLTVGCALALVGFVWLRARFGEPDALIPTPVVRDVLAMSAETIRLTPGERTAALVLRFDATGVGGATLSLRPVISFTPINGPASRATRPRLEIEVTSRGRSARHELEFRDGGATEIPVPFGSAGLASESATLRFRMVGEGRQFEFRAGDVIVLGARGRILPALARGFAVLALAAGVIGVLLLWFAGFSSAPIAFAAVLTTVLVSAVAAAWEPGAAAAWIPAFVFGDADPSQRVRAGWGVGWCDVGECAARCAVYTVAVSVGAWFPRRPEAGRSS